MWQRHKKITQKQSTELMRSNFFFMMLNSGLFRVNYDVENWRLLESCLTDENSFSTIDPLNRVQIIADVLGLSWTGKLEYSIAFDIIHYLQHEPEYLPWSTAFSSLKDIGKMLRRTPIYGYFKVYSTLFSQFNILVG